MSCIVIFRDPDGEKSSHHQKKIDKRRLKRKVRRGRSVILPRSSSKKAVIEEFESREYDHRHEDGADEPHAPREEERIHPQGKRHPFLSLIRPSITITNSPFISFEAHAA
jgi:hypothetical protein